MIMAYLFFGIALIILVCYIIMEQTLKPRTRLIYKMVNSADFLILAVLSHLANDAAEDTLFGVILLALSFGFIGDFFLGMRHLYSVRKGLYFKLGCLFFLAGHLVYLVFLIHRIRNAWLLYVIGTVAAVIVVLYLLRRTAINFGNHLLLSQSYLVIIISTFVGALMYMIYHLSLSSVIFLTGFFLFVVSDFLLSFIYFANLKYQTLIVYKMLNGLFYFSGQLLIAFSLLFNQGA